ncbi:DUF6491 family protein [Sphingobium nicotianae]|uniref:Uncharacterized protein n=1 Tax=Sphingobium nicotianae TaxID=2782607 RepID=A0A9X1DDX0_9SPHN|nr:DUF6491 family protein [Sphingobium nicotianae]MBT2188135.1 hypothetical protein [Sphingobium nicotianae]
MSQFQQFTIASAMAALAFTMSGGVQAAEQAVKAEESAQADASIPFVNHGGVRDWQAAGDNKVYIQASSGKWYLATLATPSPDLAFATAIGFETKGIDRLDRFGSIVVAGQRYPLASLVESTAPPPKPKKQG